MSRRLLSVAAPWSLSHYIPLNGFHPLYRALFDQRPDGIEINAWDNIKLYDRFKYDTVIRKVVSKAAYDADRKLKKLHGGAVAAKHEDFFWPPNRALTEMLPGDIEFHHTAPFPSLNRPFVFHCEAFSPVLIPFARQGSGEFENHENLREHYRGIFANPLCLGIFSHIPETLESFRRFFSDPEIDQKLFSSRIGLSSRTFTEEPLPKRTDLSRPKFIFVNSSNQNPENFFTRGGHIVLRFWKAYKESGRDGVLMLRCARPKDLELLQHGVDTSFLDAETGNSILWVEDYLTNYEMNRLVASAHFFLIPSHSLHSASILQALTLGAIPVITDTVGTSTYITDEEHGIVLRGVREELWAADPETGVLFDRYCRIPDLEDSLVSQLTNRIIALLGEPNAYYSMQNRAMAHARKQFSGETFSAHFWDTVTKLYQENEHHVSHAIPSPDDTNKLLKDDTLGEEDWPRVFESPTQPMLRIRTGRNNVWEMGGAFLHAFGNKFVKMELTDWSAFSAYYGQVSRKIISIKNISFSKTLGELDGKFISLNEGQSRNAPHKLTRYISRILMPFPRTYSFSSSCLKRIIYFQKFLPLKKSGTHLTPHEPALVHSGTGFNIVLYDYVYYAFPQSAGEFIKKKAEAGDYSSYFPASSVKGVLRKLSEADNNAEAELILEGFNSYNILRVGNEFHAILQSDGAFKRSKEYTYPLSGQSLDDVKRLILRKSNPSSSLSEEV